MGNSSNISKKLAAVSSSVLLLSTLFISGQVWAQSSTDSTESLISEFQMLVSELQKLQNISDEAVVVDRLNQKITDLHAQVDNLVQDGDLKPNLRSILNVALMKVDDAAAFVDMLDEMEVNNMINAADNQIIAFINAVEAEKGKKIPIELADELINDAQAISNDSQVRGLDVASFIEGLQLNSVGGIINKIQNDVQSLRQIVSILQSRGVAIDVTASPVEGFVSFFDPATNQTFQVIIPKQVIAIFITIGEKEELESVGEFLTTEEIAVLLIVNGELVERLVALNTSNPVPIIIIIAIQVGILIAQGVLLKALTDSEAQQILIELFNHFVGEPLLDLLHNTLFPTGTVSGFKFNDLNGNGTREATEPLLPGWRILLHRDDTQTAANVIAFQDTDANGLFNFNFRFPRTTQELFLEEILDAPLMQQGWVNTTPLIIPIPVEPNLNSAGTELNSHGNAFGNRQIGCVSPPSGMISWWPGDGNANDIQDGNHATLIGGATFGLGKVGQAFTNLNAPADYVRIPHAANIDLMNSAHTLDNWIFVTAFNSEWAPVTPVKLGGFGGLWYNNLGQFLRAHVWVNPTEVRFLDASFIFPTDQWIHVAQVYDQSTATLSIYVNGALVGSGARTVVPNDFGINHPILIGRGWSETVPSVSAQYSSSFDEVEIYNRALSQSEIQAIFNAGSAGKCKVIIDAENRVIENSKLKIRWDLSNPEQINEIIFKEFDPSRNLVNVFTLSPDSAFDDEFTGNSWAPPDPQAGGIVLVGRGQSPNHWAAEFNPDGAAIVEISSTGKFGVPVKTTYTLKADSSVVLIDRTFQFSVKPLDRDFRPYLFRTFSYTDFSNVVYTDNSGGLGTENVANCPSGCEKFNWNEVLADIESPTLNISIALRNSQSNPASTLWIDFDGFSQTSYVSALVKKPSLFNFNSDIFLSYSYCLHTGGIEIAEQVC